MSCQLKYTHYCQNKDCNEAFEKKCDSYRPHPPRMTQEEYKAKEAELLSELPQEFQYVASYMAWEKGRSEGYEKEIRILQEIIITLKDPIQKFEARIRK